MERAGFQQGIALFNHGDFFEAHEVWEDVWRAAPVPEKKFLQGLIQVAVAFVHYQRGNLVGARSLLRRGERNLAAYSEHYAGLHVTALLQQTADWRQTIEDQRVPERFPRVTVTVSGHSPDC
ncbi:MAG: DUF309 domain-containing protein [Acidobacteriales bacterium]|nr:DUF309 domain-containing protein [Terriglobales bacterium]